MDPDQVYLLEETFLTSLASLTSGQEAAKRLIKNLRRNSLVSSICKDFNLIFFKIQEIVDVDMEKLKMGVKDLKSFLELFNQEKENIERIVQIIEGDDPYEQQIIDKVISFNETFEIMRKIKTPILENLAGLRIIFERVVVSKFEQAFDFVLMHFEVFEWFLKFLEERRNGVEFSSRDMEDMEKCFKDKPLQVVKLGKRFQDKYIE